MKIVNKFKVVKIAKTTAQHFEDLREGQIITISCDLMPRPGYRISHYAPILMMDGHLVYCTTLKHMINKGFEFERMEAQA